MFRRVSLPTPFQVGPVNSYLTGRTIIDPGPDSEEAWSELLTALEARSLAPDDIEQVLITHPHPDHFGLAHRFSERGARIVASEPATPILEDFAGRLYHEQSYFVDFFERCGMAAETAETVTQLPEAFLNYASSVTVDQSVAAGDEVTVDDSLVTVDDLVGHSVGEVLFAFEADGERRAIVGDNVLADITPNPFLQPPADDGEARPRVLPRYNDSLDRLATAGYDRFLPGHRTDIEEPSARIEAIRADHEDRTDDVETLLDSPTTPVSVMEGLFGDLPVTEQFSGMSEAVGHLDVLEQRGRVEREESGGVVLYERA
ncbi:MBL fold metallo-hydrolase [Halomicrobium katesii]|uniref:MBL fold metallo-hydrolase n=1 Tax=Halomicrobium katesii TaxID=437163 RepID=UPI00037DAFBA|nr:MBL fold metallo-hydrolase [Halomicrobium katesii]